MFTLTKFQMKNDNVRLIFPDIHYAGELYEEIENNRIRLARWFPWADKVTSIDDEIENIKTARKNNAESTALIATILVNNKAVGVIDLHNINQTNKHAEIGYWISQSAQGQGIITECVNKISAIAFTELKLHKLSILVESENRKSCAVAKRVGFQYEATLKEHKLYKNSFKDYLVYSKFSNK
ncbi:GNAT family N-acetyltransferase [Lactococcus lactis]|uniref:GNAT family N-acetyltransferase n=1 Tax=Lactococcus lactis TaxID=1358 RepID=UPI00071C5980|nr:GNAT family protein [Lactococcus lactis]KST98916.1 Ribosomal-protein-L7p-serine acetyltransferase [Lactococcus lactis subsp. lactis]